MDVGEPLASLPEGVPLFASLGQAIAASVVPDLLVVATPTPTHVDLASQALSETSALVLVEKPLSDDPAQLAQLEAAQGRRVDERAEADGGFRCACRLSYDGGEALLTSNWLAGDSSKQTAMTFADGVEVRLDHTSMTVTVVRWARLLAHRGNDGSVGRKFAHYDGLYRALFAGEEGASAGYALARETADLLGSPASGGGGVWLRTSVCSAQELAPRPRLPSAACAFPWPDHRGQTKNAGIPW